MNQDLYKHDGLEFSFNFEEKTATVMKCSSTKNIIIIPRSITHKDHEFIITSIYHHSFSKLSIYYIQFPSNSQIEEIGSFSLFSTLIRMIAIPPSVKIIYNHAFSDCSNLEKIIITPDSQLEKMEESAFSFTKISRIFIPKNVKSIGAGSFAQCQRLKSIQFDPDSKLEEIGRQVICFTRIKSIKIPSSVSKLHPGWSEYAKHLKKVTIMPNNRYYKNYEVNENLILGKTDVKSDIFDVLVFASRKINQIEIPPFIKEIGAYSFAYTKIKSVFIPKEVTKIGECAFTECFKLTNIEFAPDSKLEEIKQSAFVFSHLNEISIPRHLKKIERCAFHVRSFQKIEIPSDSQLELIGSDAFFGSQIESLFIPSTVTKLNCFSSLKKLIDVKIDVNNPCYMNYEADKRLIFGKSDLNSDIYDVFVFASKNIKHLIIPSFIKVIQQDAIQDTLIESVVIPPQVTEIESCAFCYCQNLKHVDISSDSQLRRIGDKAFAWTNITSFYMSPLIENTSGAFMFCKNIQIIAFDDDSVFKKIYNQTIKNDNPNCIIMLPPHLAKLIVKENI